MSFADAFADIVTGFSDAFEGPYFEAQALWPGDPIKDAGGAIVTPGTPVKIDCSAQVDSATELMRRSTEYRDGDVRLVVIGIDALDTDARIKIASGPHAGTWMIATIDRDPVAIGFVCLGRRA